MIDKTALLGTALLGIGASIAAKNAAAAAADSVDTHGRKFKKTPLVGETKSKFLRRRFRQASGAAVHNFKTRAFQTGLLHGIDREKTTPSSIWTWVEATPVVGSQHPTFHYNLGYRLGARLKHLPAKEKRERLASLKDSIKALPDHRAFPHFAAAHDGIDRVLKNQKNDSFDKKFHAKLKQPKYRHLISKLQPGGFTKSLAEQETRDLVRRFKGRSGLEKATATADAVSQRIGKQVKTWTDLDRAVVGALDLTPIPGKVRKYLLKKSVRRLLPDFTETKKDKAVNVAGRVLLTPRIRDLSDASRAFRNAMLADKKRTIHAGADIAENLAGINPEILTKLLSK